MYVVPSYKKPLWRCFLSLAAIGDIRGDEAALGGENTETVEVVESLDDPMHTLSFLCVR